VPSGSRLQRGRFLGYTLAHNPLHIHGLDPLKWEACTSRSGLGVN